MLTFSYKYYLKYDNRRNYSYVDYKTKFIMLSIKFDLHMLAIAGWQDPKRGLLRKLNNSTQNKWTPMLSENQSCGESQCLGLS